MESPFARMPSIHIIITTLHDCIAVVSCYSSYTTVPCKLASKPLFRDTSVAKPTVEAVVKFEVNDEITFSIIAVLC